MMTKDPPVKNSRRQNEKKEARGGEGEGDRRRKEMR
jgi:hypothetical protein